MLAVNTDAPAFPLAAAAAAKKPSSGTSCPDLHIDAPLSGHALQDLLSGDGNVPCLHGTQFRDPGKRATSSPGVHRVHETAPFPEKEPAGQLEQFVWAPVSNLPAKHLAQLTEPPSEAT